MLLNILLEVEHLSAWRARNDSLNLYAQLQIYMMKDRYFTRGIFMMQSSPSQVLLQNVSSQFHYLSSL